MATETRERSFDELARALASGSLSRRKALRLMGGLLVGSALGSIPRVAWADDDRCSEEQTRCGDRCVNLKTNERHCGSCRNRCRSNQTCCNGNCVNLQRNERHCGRCGNRCAEGQECVGGVCGGGCVSNGGACDSGSECCSGNCKSGMCVESCIPPNAIPCDPLNPFAACGPAVPGGCQCGVEASSGAHYCVSNAAIPMPMQCTSSCDCPTGQICFAPDGILVCVAVCSPS